MKKLLSVILAVAMLAILLVGCAPPASESVADSGSTADTSASDSADDTASDEPMTISVMGVDWGYGPLANSEMELWWEEQFNVQLDIEWVSYEDYPQKVNTLISTNTQPDVTQVYKIDASYYYPIFTQAIDAGNFVELTDYLFDDGNGLAETNAVMSNWPETMWEQSTYNSGIYILPRAKSDIAKISGITVREDLMKDYGFTDEPETMEELKTWLIDLSNAATEAEGRKVYALEFYSEDFMNDRIKAFATAFTGQMDWGIDANGEFEYMQFNEKYIDFLNWMKDLYDADVLDPEFALNNNETSRWKSGNSVAFLTAWYNWNQSEDLTTNKIFDSSTPDTYEAWCLMPVEGPEAITINVNDYDVDQAIAISSACSDEKIEKILEIFNMTEETMPGYDEVLAFGVEDIHYTLGADGETKEVSEEQGTKRTEGYVGAWNQIFLKTDSLQIEGKFMRAGAAAASAENTQRATDIRAELLDYMEANPELKHQQVNLQSETYANTWATIVADVNSNCTKYVMGLMTEEEWVAFVDGIKASADYMAIQAEFKAAAGM